MRCAGSPGDALPLDATIGPYWADGEPADLEQVVFVFGQLRSDTWVLLKPQDCLTFPGVAHPVPPDQRPVMAVHAMKRTLAVVCDVGPILAAFAADESAARAVAFVTRGGVDRNAAVVMDDHLVPARDLTIHRPAVDVRIRHLLVDPSSELLNGSHLPVIGLNAEGADQRKGSVSNVRQSVLVPCLARMMQWRHQRAVAQSIEINLTSTSVS